MALYFELEDFEQQYNLLLTGAKVIVNDISTYDASKVSNAIDRLSTTINDPVLSTVPQCECGNLKYGYNIGISTYLSLSDHRFRNEILDVVFVLTLSSTVLSNSDRRLARAPPALRPVRH